MFFEALLRKQNFWTVLLSSGTDTLFDLEIHSDQIFKGFVGG